MVREGSEEKKGENPVSTKKRLSFSGAEREALADIEADPTNPRHHWNLMVVFEMRKDWEGALEQVELYIAKGDPDQDGQAKKEALVAKMVETKAKKKRIFSSMFGSKRKPRGGGGT